MRYVYERILRTQYKAVVAALLTANNDSAINEIRSGSVHKTEGRIYNNFFVYFVLEK